MSIPLVALMGQQYQPESLLSAVGKAQAIKSSQQQQEQSAQAFPIEQQQRQATLQGTQQQNQLTQFNIQDRQGIAQALRDSYGGPQAGTATQQISPSLGTSGVPASQSSSSPSAPSQPANPTDRLAALTARIQDPKYGISPQGQMALIEQLTGLGQKVETLNKDKLGNIETAHKIIAEGLNSVLEAPPEDQAAQWTLERNQLLRHPTLGQFLGNIPAQYPGQPAPGGSPEAQSALHSLMAEQDIVSAAKQKNEAPEQVAKASQAVQGASAPTSQQISDAAGTIQTYAAIPGNMRAGLLKELQNAPDYATLQKVQQRADAANESFQRSADARQQAMALKDVATTNLVAGKLVTEDQKLGGALDQTAGIRGLLNQSKGGNEVATAAAQTRFAEHEIVEGGVKRMNQTEYNNLATSLGDYGRQFKAWADKGFDGQMPPATNAEMGQILDAEDQAANATHERNVGYIANRYGGAKAQGGGAKSNTLPGSGKSLTLAQLQAAARGEGRSLADVTAEAKEQGYGVP